MTFWKKGKGVCKKCKKKTTIYTPYDYCGKCTREQNKKQLWAKPNRKGRPEIDIQTYFHGTNETLSKFMVYGMFALMLGLSIFGYILTQHPAMIILAIFFAGILIFVKRLNDEVKRSEKGSYAQRQKKKFEIMKKMDIIGIWLLAMAKLMGVFFLGVIAYMVGGDIPLLIVWIVGTLYVFYVAYKKHKFLRALRLVVKK